MAQLKDLIVTGQSRFIGDMYGNLKGNAMDSVALNGINALLNPVSDLNNFYTGICLVNNTVANNPFVNNLLGYTWCLIVSGGYGGTVSQVAFNLQNGFSPLTRRCDTNTWSGWEELNMNYLPLDGSKPMTNQVYLGGGNGAVGADGNHAYIQAYDADRDGDNLRHIILSNHNHYANLDRALQLRDMVNGAYTDYRIWHEGNCNQILKSASAPSPDNATIWFDTTNKVFKHYVDGAWQQINV